MSYFNFKLFNRPVKNVNTDLAFKKGNWAPGYPVKGRRAPILGYRKSVDCSNNCQNEKIYKDNWAKSCARNGEACYNPVIKRIQNNNRKPAKPYYYNTRNLLRSRFSTYEQNAYNFDLSGNLTAWGGGADPANNSYLIHDCSCNAPFTGNNPCIATYKPLNRQFAVNTAVSGRSRIARLKYNAKKRVAATKKIPFGLLGYPKNSCEFCKRDFKPSKGRKGGDNKSRINSRLGPIIVPPTCCGETLPAGVIKICTQGNPGCETGCNYDYEIVGALIDPKEDWTGVSGCEPTCGRLGQLPYPVKLGEICPTNATYRGFTIGGFAWNFNASERHLWFFLSGTNFNASGFQFDSIEFSDTIDFTSPNTFKLYGRAEENYPTVQNFIKKYYKSNTQYEVHWSPEGPPPLVNWNPTSINNIFGTNLNANKEVFIRFELDSAVTSEVKNLTLTPGNQQITLSWDPPDTIPAGHSLTGYQILRAATSNDFQIAVVYTVSAPTTTFTDPTLLVNGTEYWYGISAITDNDFQNTSLYVFGSATPQIILPGSFIANMPANRGQSPAVAGYNNKLYVFGGKYGGGPTPPYSTYDTFVVYDTVTNSWSEQTPTMSEKRAWVYGAIWQDKVYIYSGTDDQTAASHQSMEIYDITNNSFTSVNPTPDKRTYYAAGAINGKIYICGGYMLGTGNTDSLMEYNISTGIFTAKTSMPQTRVQHAAAVYDNKLYVMGGNGTGTLNSLIVYDPTLNSWATTTVDGDALANMPESRYSLKAVTLGSYIYAVGGSDGGLTNTVFRYDPDLNTWSTVTPMLTARASFGLGVANNAMYAVGNYSGTTNDGERIL